MTANLWTAEQMDHLFETGFLTHRDRAFFGILRYLGARQRTVIQLTVHDVNLIGRLILCSGDFSKTGKTHYCTIPEPLQRVLECYRPQTEALFPDWIEGGALSRLQISKILQEACLRADLPYVGVHYFRRWLYQNLLQNAQAGESGQQIRVSTADSG